jgi:hypothetical protein
MAGNNRAILLIDRLRTALANPMIRTSLEHEDSIVTATRATYYTIGPAHLNQELLA